MHGGKKLKFSGPCANDAQKFLRINFESLEQRQRIARSSIGIEIDRTFFWHNQIPDAATQKQLEDADKCTKREHDGTDSVAKFDKAPMEEKKKEPIGLQEGVNKECVIGR